MSDVKTFPNLASAQRAVAAVTGPPPWRNTGAWDLSQVLNHAAQSIEFSMHGFPELKSALFRNTAGRAAFAVFDARGVMSHGLAEPIPGAPALPAGAKLEDAVAHLLKAMAEFDAYTGPLQPHFAYGALDKPQFTRAHLMHLANHWTEVVAG